MTGHDPLTVRSGPRFLDGGHELLEGGRISPPGEPDPKEHADRHQARRRPSASDHRHSPACLDGRRPEPIILKCWWPLPRVGPKSLLRTIGAGQDLIKAGSIAGCPQQRSRPLTAAEEAIACDTGSSISS